MKEEDYEAILQNTLIDIYKYIHTYDPSRPLANWVITVVKHLIFEYYRKLKEQRHEGVYLNLPRCYHSIQEDSPVNDVRLGIDTLKPIFRNVVHLRMEGHKLKEITEILYKNGELPSRNTETVKSRIFLAKRKLRRVLNQDGTLKSYYFNRESHGVS